MPYPIRNAQMLTLQEHQEISEAIQTMDAQFTDDILDSAEYYEIDEDPVTLMTTVTLYDANGAVLSSATIEDYDTAEAYLEEFFDLEEFEPEEADDEAAAVNSRYGHAD